MQGENVFSKAPVITEMCKIVSTEKACIAYLPTMGLLNDQWLCENCRLAMCLVYGDGSDGETFHCSICGGKCSIRKDPSLKNRK